MKARIVMFIIVTSVVLGAGGLYYNLTASKGSASDPQHERSGTGLIGGPLAPVPSFEDLVRHSDVVAQGRVTAKTSNLESCCPSMADRLPDSMPAPVRLVESVTLSVDNTLKGTAGSEITVKTEKEGGNVWVEGDEERALLTFEVGEVYLLFLAEQDDHYKVQGFEMGRWTTDGDALTQTDTGVTFSRAEIAQKVAEHID